MSSAVASNSTTACVIAWRKEDAPNTASPASSAPAIANQMYCSGSVKANRYTLSAARNAAPELRPSRPASASGLRV
ncbi:Uncharacterised protein [Mycobacteroides abscessus subsp. abscessus]|nr:Uncharacterised protein [Mycobacteroides abscessus subsp. abscessus]